MKKSIILIATIIVISILVLIFSFGMQPCATCPKNCPPQDVVFSVGTPIGNMPVKMRKGHLNPDKEKENWVTSQEFDRQMNQLLGTEEEKQELKKEGQKHGI